MLSILPKRFEETRKRITKRLAKARAQRVEQDFPKLPDAADDTAVIHENPPLIYHGGLRDMDVIQQAFARYRENWCPNAKSYTLSKLSRL
jgi:CHAD domain-containing protein